MTKALDQHKTRVGKRRKDFEKILMTAMYYDDQAVTDAQKARLWEALIRHVRTINER